MHSALVAHQSPALDALVNGEFREGLEKCATWESVDQQTFIRFGQFAYTGSYNAAKPSTQPPASDLPNDTETIQSSQENTLAASKPTKKKTISLANSATQQRAWQDFLKERRYLFKSAAEPPIEKNNDPMQDYTDVFLSHAKLHVLADCYGIESLMRLTLYRLHCTLCHFKLFNERTGDIIELLTYCYVEGPDDLKELVSTYAVCYLPKLWVAKGFQTLLLEHAELSIVLVGNLLHYQE